MRFPVADGHLADARSFRSTISAAAIVLLLPDAAGPMDPVRTTPGRPPGSIRRTSSIDTARPDGLRGDLIVTARARDLLTTLDGTATVVAEAQLDARIHRATRALLSLDTVPGLVPLERLIGAGVGPGFRARMAEAAPDELAGGTLLHLLLDDLPGATLVSGYAMQRGGALEEARPAPTMAPTTEAPPTVASPAPWAGDDLCAGWAHDATMMVTIRTKGVIPLAIGPPAPALESEEDLWAWHDMPPLGPHAMRRRRRLDVVLPTGPQRAYRLDVHFRDSHMDEDGQESVLHEYAVSGGVDGSAGRVTEMSAEARVLPWVECPGAVASAGRLVGMPLADLRTWVRREMTGASTCTHLNDTLRSLGDVTGLVSVLTGIRPAMGPGTW